MTMVIYMLFVFAEMILHLIGIGLGTVIAVFNHCLKRKMDELAGMEA